MKNALKNNIVEKCHQINTRINQVVLSTKDNLFETF
jgi:hypothetical protein